MLPITSEYRIYGAPGTGKTTTLIKSVTRAIEEASKDSVIVSSFTRAATHNIIERVQSAGVQINQDNVRTLHSHGYRLAGLNKPVAESSRFITFWNESYPQWGINVKKSDIDDVMEIGSDDDTDTGGMPIINRYHNLRHRMIERELWPNSVRDFATAWEDFKYQVDAIDFTDMIEIPLHEELRGSFSIGYFDEAQDFTALELALIRQWGKSFDKFVLVGDPYQSIYGFKGATPDAFLETEIPEEQTHILRQSHRVPSDIFDMAKRLVSYHGMDYFDLAKVKPRNGIAVIERVQASFQEPDTLLERIERHIQNDESVMILVTCGYMLNKTISMLRSAAVPFHNPYRMVQGNWNPLRLSSGDSSKSGKKQIGTVARILSYCRSFEEHYGTEYRLWNATDVRNFSEHLKSEGVMYRGAKKDIDAYGRTGEIGYDQLLKWFTDDAMESMFDDVTLKWFRENIIESKKAAYQFPLHILDIRGAEALRKAPKVIVGTIHSVKGAEADWVYLFPDVSAAGYDAMLNGQHGLQAAARQFYVALTRSKYGLGICRASSDMAMKV